MYMNTNHNNHEELEAFAPVLNMGKHTGKPNNPGLPPTGIPQYMTNLPGMRSNQVPGKTNIIERNMYLKNNNSQNVPTPTRTTRKSETKKEDKLKHTQEASTSEKMETDSIDDLAEEVTVDDTKTKPMKRPAEDSIDLHKNKRENITNNSINDDEIAAGSNEEKKSKDKLIDTSLPNTSVTNVQNSQAQVSAQDSEIEVLSSGNFIHPTSQSQSSNQITQLKKIALNKFKEFDIYDKAPFKMFLQNVDNSSERINPLLINKFLITKFKNKDVFEECYPIAKNKVCIVAKSLKIANEVLNLKEWKEQKKEIFIPNHLKTRQGVIKGIPAEFSEEEILQNLEVNDPHFGTIHILNVRRFTRKNRDPQTGKLGPAIPTKTVLITFRGQYLPPRVVLYKIRRSVEIYYPQVRQCYRCYNFGHLKANCKSAIELCLRCAEPTHSVELTCPRKELQPQCKNCKQGHIAIDKSCEVRKRQQYYRDYATENNISVAEAKKIIFGKNTYNHNSNEYPSLYNRWSPLQETPNYETCDSPSYAEAATQKWETNKARPALREHSPRANNRGKYQKTQQNPNQYSQDSHKRRSHSQTRISEKYQEMRNLHNSLLISPNGHIPNRRMDQLCGKPNYVPHSQTQKCEEGHKTLDKDEDLQKNCELEENIQIVSELLEKMSVEKVYQALKTILMQKQSYQKAGHSSKDPDLTRHIQQITCTPASNDDQWKLEYSMPLDPLTQEK
ncbi:hypothetical protein QAD02_023841 [Eretmocerus hayati]|uniref:Uncharacterized protein n=1 Tax=Eretmocerus hayati TaxID=131215 RepID=A0ACC2PZ48_9HYME|nr:hypothetical protein QAD02_023841 [Eretmocerus hayati]